MADENKQTTKKEENKKMDKKEIKPAVVTKDVKKEDIVNTKNEDKVNVNDNKSGAGVTDKSTGKKDEKKIVKKEEAFARGLNLHISKKHAMYICSFIKGKNIDKAISELQEVLKYKRIIPYKGEIPHRHAVGIMAGRYPINASKVFINVLKGLKGNVIVNGMDLEKTVIVYGSPSWASRPARSGGVTAKRVNLIIKAKELNEGKLKEAKK